MIRQFGEESEREEKKKNSPAFFITW